MAFQLEVRVLNADENDVSIFILNSVLCYKIIIQSFLMGQTEETIFLSPHPPPPLPEPPLPHSLSLSLPDAGSLICTSASLVKCCCITVTVVVLCMCNDRMRIYVFYDSGEIIK